MAIEEYVNTITKHLIHDKDYGMKIKLNAIYGKQIYNLSKTEKEYLINDARSTFCAYMFNRCCGKTWWLNNLLNYDTIIEESETRTMSRTHLITDTKIKIQFRHPN